MFLVVKFSIYLIGLVFVMDTVWFFRQVRSQSPDLISIRGCDIGANLFYLGGRSRSVLYRDGSTMISERVRFDQITVVYAFEKTGLSKQCSPRSDAAERGVWSGSILFAIHPTILQTFTVSKLNLLRSIRYRIMSLNIEGKIYSKFPLKLKFRVQEGFDRPLPPPLPPLELPLNAPLAVQYTVFNLITTMCAKFFSMLQKKKKKKK